MSDGVTNKRPPYWLLRGLNVLMRRILPTSLGRNMPMGMLRVTGRRTGRRYEIPIGVWKVDEGMVVFTDARWLANFSGGTEADLVHRGKTQRVYGQGVLATGVNPNQVGISIPRGHTITDGEAAALRKAILLVPKT
jgi:hypothetical protein